MFSAVTCENEIYCVRTHRIDKVTHLSVRMMADADYNVLVVHRVTRIAFCGPAD